MKLENNTKGISELSRKTNSVRQGEREAKAWAAEKLLDLSNEACSSCMS